MKIDRNIDNNLTGQIIAMVCEVWGVSRVDLVAKSRRRPLPWARAMLCKYLRQYAGHDSVSCSAILNRDYESISHYQVHYIEYMQTYVQFRDRDATVRRRLRSLSAKYTKQ